METRKNIDQVWNLKLFTGLGERNIIDIGSLLALKITEAESIKGKEFIIVAIMVDGVEIALTKWLDSEDKAMDKLFEFQDIITKRLKFFFYPENSAGRDIWKNGKKFNNQTRKDLENLDKENELEI